MCDQASQDKIINRLEWNKIYYFTLAGVTTLRQPQWFLQGVNFFRKIAIWVWLSHVLLAILHWTVIWMVNSAINEGCSDSDAVLNDEEVFGWNQFRSQQYWFLGIVPLFALVGMFRSKRTQDCF